MTPTLLAYLMLDASIRSRMVCMSDERLEIFLSAMDKLWYKLSSEEVEAFNTATIMELEGD